MGRPSKKVSLTMNTEDLQDDRTDVQERYAYQLAVGDLAFRQFHTLDPAPAGVQILAAAALRPASAYSLVALLPSGDFEDIRLNEPYDLRGKGVERLIAFQTDRLYRLDANGAQVLWGVASIPATVLRELTGASPDQAIFLDVPGGQDRLIPDDGALDLNPVGVERVILAPKPNPGFEVVVIYNGQPTTVRVTPHELIQAVLDAARAAFGHPPGELALFNEAGGELNPGQTVQAAGVHPHDRLLLRPRVVQGG
ncbi:hypothetical protein PMI01_00723 [Caulobacter sp. AP07]|nr:hypothetical protein PMI01_00723 [Caulobacter sp. AP07]